MFNHYFKWLPINNFKLYLSANFTKLPLYRTKRGHLIQSESNIQKRLPIATSNSGLQYFLSWMKSFRAVTTIFGTLVICLQETDIISFNSRI